MNGSIKLHVIQCGEVQVDIALPFQQMTLNPYAFMGLFRSKKYQVILPVSVFLVEHPKGLILIDTGWHSDLRHGQLKYLGLIHYMINKAILPEGETVTDKLDTLGIKPRDLDYVILSHLHDDHASGVKLVRKAKNIMTSEVERVAAQKSKLHYVHHMWEGVNLKTFKLTSSAYGPQHRSFDLFGDDSMVFVHVPGHTPGLVATLIQRNGRFVLLTSDCAYAKKSWQQMITPGVMFNKKQSMESLSWVREMSQKSGCIEVIASHDPDVKPHSIEI